MLLWQQKSMRKRTFLLQLCGLVVFLHIVALCILFLPLPPAQFHLHVSAQKPLNLEADVILLPFVKVVEPVSPSTSSTSSGKPVKSKPKGVTSVVEDKKTSKKQVPVFAKATSGRPVQTQ